jgi:hypothetical protein
MPFSNYTAPGVLVDIQTRERNVTDSQTLQYYPVFIGQGQTSFLRHEETVATDWTNAITKTKDFSALHTTLGLGANLDYLKGSIVSIEKIEAEVSSTPAKFIDITSRISKKTTGTVNNLGAATVTFDSVTNTFNTAKLTTAINNSTTSVTFNVDDVSKLYLKTSNPANPYVSGSTPNNQFLKIGTVVVRVTDIVGNTITAVKTNVALTANIGDSITALPSVQTKDLITIPSGSQYDVITFSLQPGTSTRLKVGQKLKFTTGNLAASSTEEVAISEIDHVNSVIRCLRLAATPIVNSTAQTIYLYMENATGDYAHASTTKFKVVLDVSKSGASFEPQLIELNDRFNAQSLLGDFFITETKTSSVTIQNDVRIAAQIAFNMGVPAFYYVETERKYAEKPTLEDYKKALEKIYFKSNIYRVVPLTSDKSVLDYLRNFVEDISNPIDQREVVGFVSADLSNMSSENLNNIFVLESEVGSLSQGWDSSRIINVFGAKTVTMELDRVDTELPEYFLNVAVACADAALGIAAPISSQEISAGFKAIQAPNFRSMTWNQLAKHGVLIVVQNNETGVPYIRHQLTTSQTQDSSKYEYSLVKNRDAVYKLFRQKFSNYVGRQNISNTLLERLGATLTLAIEEAKALNIIVQSGWSVKTTTENGESKTTLGVQLELVPSYPANNIEIIFVI